MHTHTHIINMGHIGWLLARYSCCSVCKCDGNTRASVHRCIIWPQYRDRNMNYSMDDEWWFYTHRLRLKEWMISSIIGMNPYFRHIFRFHFESFLAFVNFCLTKSKCQCPENIWVGNIYELKIDNTSVYIQSTAD